MPEQTLETFLESKIKDGAKQKYEEGLQAFDIANQYVGHAIQEYLKQLIQNRQKYVEIFDTLDYEPNPVIDIKTFESVYANIFAGYYKEEEIFTKMPDIARARIVCRTLSQVKFMKQNLVSGNLLQKWKLKLDETKNFTEKPTASGYRATNYHLIIPKDILHVPHDIKYELQIMTEMQNTWVELSHILFYKNRRLRKEEVTFGQSQMIRISGMIEIIDEMYEDIREEVKKKPVN